MTFARRQRRDKTPRLRGATVGSGLLVRTVIVGLLAIAGAAWGLMRHYTYRPPPMRVPIAPRETPAFDEDAGELPVPDLAIPDGEVP
jgi:hypothetical protein